MNEFKVTNCQFWIKPNPTYVPESIKPQLPQERNREFIFQKCVGNKR